MKRAVCSLSFAVLATFLFATTAEAQRMGTCRGIPGPQIFHVDFGSGPNPGPPFPRGTTDYAYNADCAISPGEYTVRNSMIACRRNWHDVHADHTPNDFNGYFLAVDAGDHAGVVWQTTVNGLTPGVEYLLSAWAANLASSTVFSPPDLTFQMEDLAGTVLSSTRVIMPRSNVFEWLEGTGTFVVPPNVTDVVLKIITNRGGTSGNDFLIDDLNFSMCYSPMVASFSSSSIVTRQKACDQGRADLYATWPPSGNPFQNVSYQWQRSTDGGATWADLAGATLPTTTYFESAPGVYHYRIVTFESANPSLTMASDPIVFHVVKLMVDAQSYTFYACAGTQYQLTANAYWMHDDPIDPLPVQFAFNWSPPDYLDNPSSPTPVITLPQLTPPSPGGPPAPPIIYNYTVTATHAFCTGQAPVRIEYRNPRKVMVPNAFTPNNDGINDVFRPINITDYPGARFEVWNRWGGLIFESNGPNYDWDGKYQGVDQPIGGYPWIVELPFCKTNIYSSSEGDGVSKGMVILSR